MSLQEQWPLVQKERAKATPCEFWGQGGGAEVQLLVCGSAGDSRLVPPSVGRQIKDTLVGFSCHVLVLNTSSFPAKIQPSPLPWLCSSYSLPFPGVFHLLQPFPLGKGEQEPFVSSLWRLQWQNPLQFQQAELLPCSFRLCWSSCVT